MRYTLLAMERRLIVLRHAKSAWDTDAPDDHSRPLNARGKKDAPRIAARLAELGWLPQVVVSSDSMRTRQTWARMEEALGADADVTFLRRFYHGGLGAVREIVSGVADDVSSVMVIGHNPGWEDMASELAGGYVNMTTCNAALLTVKADDWAEALSLEGCWEMQALLRPKEL